MAVNLQALLQAITDRPDFQTPGYGDSTLPGYGQNTLMPPVQGEDIPVNAPVQQITQQVPQELQPPLEPVQATPEQVRSTQTMEGLPQHKGLFGIKGTLRNVLGTLGDSLLIGSGKEAIYRPVQQRERMSDALAGYGPGKELDAIRRAIAVDPAAISLYENWQKRLQDQREGDIREKGIVATTQNKRATNQLQKIKVAQQWAANTKDPAVLANIKSWIQDPDATLDDIPDELLALSAIPAYQQQMLGQGEKRLGIQQQNADANTTRASRPPQGRAAPQPTAASIAAPILSKAMSGKPLSRGEQEVLNRLGMSPDRGTGKTRRPPPSAPSKPSGSGSWGKMITK